MSIINQVLNELEQRGANSPLGEGAIRAVPPRRQSHVAGYAIAGAALLVLLGAAKWYFGRQASPAPENPAVMAAPAIVQVTSLPASGVVSAPVEAGQMPGASGVAVVSQPVDSLHGKPLLEVASEDEPVAMPEVKKAARKRPQRVTPEVAETDDARSLENPELLKKTSPQQRAEGEFLKANHALQEGRTNDALNGYEAALLIDPTYKPARRAWVAALVSLKRNDEAEQVLKRGLKRDSHDAAFAMMQARLQVERDALPVALETLQKTLPYAEDQADYRAFVAAVLQRLDRHDEAVAHYRAALKIAPNNGVWWMGLGISLQALQRTEEARDAYQRALATNSLNPQLQGYVQQKLKDL